MLLACWLEFHCLVYFFPNVCVETFHKILKCTYMVECRKCNELKCPYEILECSKVCSCVELKFPFEKFWKQLCWWECVNPIVEIFECTKNNPQLSEEWIKLFLDVQKWIFWWYPKTKILVLSKNENFGKW